MKSRRISSLITVVFLLAASPAVWSQISADKTLADVESAEFSAPIAGTALNATITTSSNFPPEIGRAIAAAFPPNMIFKSSDLPPGTDLNAIYQGCATMVSEGEDGDGGLAAAAYTSGSGAEIAMLSVEDGRAEILDAVNDSKYSFAGGYCRAYAYNLTNPSDPDDSPLAHAFEISFNGEDWFFGWDGQKLVNLTPTNDFQKMSPPITDIYGADVVDIDRTGPLQIMGNNGDWNSIRRSDGIMSSGTYTLFRYNGKKFAPSSKYRAFIDDSGLSGYQMHGYGMHHTPAPSYIMTVLNGARDGRRRVRGATITLDGVKIFGPAEINKSEGRVSQVVNLKHMGEIDVNIQGGDNAVFYILIQKTQ